MVGIVIVSHSATLAAGVKELAEQMVQGKVSLATAGGIDDADNPIGTDPIKVQQAIESVYSDDGVLVLMDLGSAVLSAEMALEFLTPQVRDNVRLVAAPLVEGALAAAVQASVGGSLAQVAVEALGALAVKAEQLGDEALPEEMAQAEEAVEGALSLTLTVQNRMGLHARPAAQFVGAASRFRSDIRIAKGGNSANAKSINQVARLSVRQGDEVQITAVGDDARAALAAIEELAGRNFGEENGAAAETAVPTQTAEIQPKSAAERTPSGALRGIPVSPGIAVGGAFIYRPQMPPVPDTLTDDPWAAWQRLQTAVSAALAELDALQRRAEKQIGAADAAIFEAHQLFLQDPDLQQRARALIFDQQQNEVAAWHTAFSETAAAFEALENATMRARAADVTDVGNRVLRRLLDVALPSLALDEPAVLIAVDLSPSDTAQLDPQQVLGICTELGGATSHSAILARALAIPAVVGVGAGLTAVSPGQVIALDGEAGVIWTDPDAEQLAELRQARQAWLEARQAVKSAAQQPAVTRDGRRIEVAANIGGPQDTAVALEYGAEGVGLFRTEFLFLDRTTAPDEAEQLAAYRQAAQAMGERPLIIRTLDVGGDKPLPYLDLGEEENPFLGWRGIRFCLDTPQVFKPQLRAILRAGVAEDGALYNVKIMFPMVGSLEEVKQARALLAEAQQELHDEGVAFNPQMEVGIMIEVPSAVAIADQLAREVDFFSIGTNDLTQYVMAADRGNAKVAGLAQALQPAVLRMIRMTVEAAHDAGIWVGMCGELAGNALAAPLLLGLGLDELSMSAPSIPAVKEAVRALTLPDAEKIAEAVLKLESATAVVDYLQAQATT